MCERGGNEIVTPQTFLIVGIEIEGYGERSRSMRTERSGVCMSDSRHRKLSLWMVEERAIPVVRGGGIVTAGRVGARRERVPGDVVGCSGKRERPSATELKEGIFQRGRM